MMVGGALYEICRCNLDIELLTCRILGHLLALIIFSLSELSCEGQESSWKLDCLTHLCDV